VSDKIRVLEGSVQFLIDVESGLVMSVNKVQVIESSACRCVLHTSYVNKRAEVGTIPDPGLFVLPATNTKQVRELPRWDESKVRKSLLGSPTPEIAGKDLNGAPITLSAFQGKTVLLDFWATWCPPCSVDAPALQKLHQRYGDKQLAILGISMAEERKIVEQFLQEHPAGYPILLSGDSKLPRPYQVQAIPTYIVIGPDGTVRGVEQGDQGFRKLRNLLKKAGLETE
jgi:thiol-disulfide isomerase/thioredoxin